MHNGFYGPAIRLKEADYVSAAKLLGCDVPAVKAVAEVEGAGSGFLSDGRPKILFESAKFHKFTNGRWTGSHSHISTSEWVRNYKGGAAEYGRLYEAMGLDEEAALLSCSWGLMQVMGFNWQTVKCLSIDDYVHQCCFSESAHLQSFCMFCITNNLDKPLRDHQWATFARGYNGPGYAENAYDVKLKESYNKHSTGAPSQPGGGMSVLEIQMALNAAGADPKIQRDGLMGPATRLAIKQFQAAHGLDADGIVGPDTEAKLRPYLPG